MVVVRLHIFVLLLILSTGCTLGPSKIEKAPENPEQAVVFDIDGTLTPRPFAIFTVREGAASAVRLFADKGFKIIYLSARIKPLQAGIPSWLDKHNFPKGNIHVPQTMADAYDHAIFPHTEVSKILVSLFSTPSITRTSRKTRSKSARLDVCTSATKSQAPLVVCSVTNSGNPRSERIT